MSTGRPNNAVGSCRSKNVSLVSGNRKTLGFSSEHLAFWRHCRVDSNHGTRRQGEGIASTHANLQVIAGLERRDAAGRAV